MSINHWFSLIPSVFIQVSLHGQILNSNDCPSTLRSQKFHCICQLLLAWFLAFCSVQLKNKQTSPGEIWGRMNDKNVTITSVSPPSLLDLHPSNLSFSLMLILLVVSEYFKLLITLISVSGYTDVSG